MGFFNPIHSPSFPPNLKCFNSIYWLCKKGRKECWWSLFIFSCCPKKKQNHDSAWYTTVFSKYSCCYYWGYKNWIQWQKIGFILGNPRDSLQFLCILPTTAKAFPSFRPAFLKIYAIKKLHLKQLRMPVKLQKFSWSNSSSTQESAFS